jgi:pimeloyl-ACP methyl ester carboxylesterase
MSDPPELRIDTPDGVTLSGQQSGSGQPIVLLHGLTATRRYVVMGSRALERSGHRVIAYDARGHGRSSPSQGSREYGYERLSRDLEALLDQLDVEHAVLAGASMGAHTAVRFALAKPERVAGLALITPAFDANRDASAQELEQWDKLARGLREGGVEGFVDAYDFSEVPTAWRATVEKVLRQRLATHEHPLAVADALEAVPRSRPFEDMHELASIDAPTVVVASRDDADPGHPLIVGESYAATIPSASIVVEEPGSSPIAWQGGQLSRVLAELAATALGSPTAS